MDSVLYVHTYLPSLPACGTVWYACFCLLDDWTGYLTSGYIDASCLYLASNVYSDLLRQVCIHTLMTLACLYVDDVCMQLTLNNLIECKP